MSIDETRSLQPQLKEIEKEMEARVSDLCQKMPIERLDTGEMIRYEEKLTLAAEAAKEAVTLRRRIGVQREAAIERGLERGLEHESSRGGEGLEAR